VGATSILLGVALPALAGFAGTDLFLPMVGRQAGVFPSNWYTTIWVHNPGSQAATARISFLERGTANFSPPWVDVLVGPGDTEKIENVVESLFQRQAYGALRVTCATQKLVVTSRVFSKLAGEDDTDSMGQDFAGVPASFAIGLGERTQVLAVHQTVPAEDSEFRFNFGAVETTGHTVMVRFTAYDGNGADLGHTDLQVREHSQRQVAFKDHFPAASEENARLEVEVISGAGRVIAYGSLIANASQDPTTFEMTYADTLLAGGLTAVQHDATLVGDGSAGAPLGLADGAVTLSKIAAGASPGLSPPGALQAFPSAQPSVLTTDGSSLAWTATGMLTLPIDASVHAVGDAAVIFRNTATSGVSYGMIATLGANPPVITGPQAIQGTTETGVGVVGNSSSGNGVYGYSANGDGVRGVSWSGGDGVYGYGGATNGVLGESGTGYGVHGSSLNGDGVFGEASAANKSGVYAVNANPAGWAGYFAGRVGITGDLSCTGCVGDGDLASSAVTKGKLAAAGGTTGQVLGTSDGTSLVWRTDGLGLPFDGSTATGWPTAAFRVANQGSGGAIEGYGSSGEAVRGLVGGGATIGAPGATGVFGIGAGGAYGVVGTSAAGTGVYGETTGSGQGVRGKSAAGHGVYGESLSAEHAGVSGYSSTSIGVKGHSASGFGVRGTTNSFNLAAVAGVHTGQGAGFGVAGHASSGVGVQGESTTGVGVEGKSSSGYGIHGVSITGDGVFAEASAANKSGLYAVNPNAAGYAGFFGGRVGITTLTGAGNRAVYADAGGVLTNSSSDVRLKRDVADLAEEVDVLAALARLRGVAFNWDTTVDRARGLGDQREIGMIAQEVEAVLPQLVGESSDGYKALDYAKLTAFLVEVTKAQQREIDALRAEVASMRNGLP